MLSLDTVSPYSLAIADSLFLGLESRCRRPGSHGLNSKQASSIQSVGWSYIGFFFQLFERLIRTIHFADQAHIKTCHSKPDLKLLLANLSLSSSRHNDFRAHAKLHPPFP